MPVTFGLKGALEAERGFLQVSCQKLALEQRINREKEIGSYVG